MSPFKYSPSGKVTGDRVVGALPQPFQDLHRAPCIDGCTEDYLLKQGSIHQPAAAKGGKNAAGVSAAAKPAG